MPTKPLHPGPLLIVDDRVEVRSALTRFFGLWFQQVYAAASPSEADSILREHAPCVLLCDYWLGDASPPGTELIATWRVRFPCLKRAVLMTGNRASAPCDVLGVDAVFQKPPNLKLVTAFLLGQIDQVPPEQ